MYKQALSLAALLALAACGGSGDGSGSNGVSNTPTTKSINPVTGTFSTEDEGAVTDPDTTTGIPEDLALNVSNIEFDAAAGTLTVEGPPLDGSPVAGVYDRAANLDVPGYQAFLKQDDRLSRVFVAVAAESPDGAVRASTVSDGGQFNIFFRGNDYERVIPLTRPATTDPNGQVSYAGFYAGVTNLDDLSQSSRLEPAASDPVEAQPFQPRQTQGKVFMNVDFADNSVEGVIYDRQFTDGKPLDSLALTVDQNNASNLDDNGEFTGNVEFLGQPDQGVQGTYGGIIGGENASAMAGSVALNNLFSDSADQDDSSFDREVGSFVLPRCGTETAPDLCNGLSDVE